MTAQEQQDLQAHDSWRAWGKQFGWKLYGSNGSYSAGFFMQDCQGNRMSNFEVTRDMRSSIDKATATATPEADAERDTLRDALEFYAAEGSWQQDIAPDPAGSSIPGSAPAECDYGNKAREALVKLAVKP